VARPSSRGAGYSGTPLPGKLGITEGTEVIALDTPRNYQEILGALPSGARVVPRLPSRAQFVHLFVTSRARLSERLVQLRGVLVPDGVLWVSWPKRASGVTTDVTEDVIREVALPLQFVDVKVCAVDDTWSGLKLVIRKAAR
jgi:hypothetical protein